MHTHHDYVLRLTFYILGCLLLSSQSLYAKCDLINIGNVSDVQIALIIGNSHYDNGTLKHPVNDATQMAKVLREIGFKVIPPQFDLNYQQINNLTWKFSECLKSRKNSVGFFYFSGHGTQITEGRKKKNYLLPIDNAYILDSRNVKQRAFPVQVLLDRLESAGNDVNIIILDASRDNPYPGSSGGLAKIQSSRSFIAYPTAENKIVVDSWNTNNSLYIRHLSKELKIAARNKKNKDSIEKTFRKLRKAVQRESNRWQQPYFNSSLRVNYCFGGCRSKHIIVPPPRKTKKRYPPRVQPLERRTTLVDVRAEEKIQKISSVAFSPNGRYALSGGQDKTVRLWDLHSGKLVYTFKGHSDLVTSVSFSPDGKYALSGSKDRTVRRWDLKQGRLLDTYRGHNGLVSSVTFSSDGRYILSGSYDRSVQLWEKRDGRLMRRFKKGNWVLSVAISSQGDRAVAGNRDKKMRLWDLDSGKLLRTFRGRSYFRSVKFFPNGDRVLSGNSDNKVRIWDVRSGRVLHTFKGHYKSVTSVDVSPKGRDIVSGSRDNTVRLWSASGRHLHTFKGHSDDVNSVKFSSDAQRILSGGNDGIFLWHAKTKRQIARLIVFSDGEWVTFLPTGFFTGSSNGGQKLSIRVDGFELRNNASFYHPELLKSKLRQ